MCSAKLCEGVVKCLLPVLLFGCGPKATTVSPADEAKIKEESVKAIKESQRIQAEHVAKMLKNQNQATKDQAAKRLAESQTPNDN